MLVTWFEDESTQPAEGHPSGVAVTAAATEGEAGGPLPLVGWLVVGGAGTRRTLRGARAPAVAPRRRDARVRPGGVARRDGARRAVRPGQPLPAPPVVGGGRARPLPLARRPAGPGQAHLRAHRRRSRRADGVGRAPSNSCPTPSPPSGGATRKEAHDASQHACPHPSSHPSRPRLRRSARAVWPARPSPLRRPRCGHRLPRGAPARPRAGRGRRRHQGPAAEGASGRSPPRRPTSDRSRATAARGERGRASEGVADPASADGQSGSRASGRCWRRHAAESGESGVGRGRRPRRAAGAGTRPQDTGGRASCVATTR